MYNKQVQIAPGVCIVYTMSTAVIVPEKDQQCTQWISFNGENEPVLNTSPDVDNCDTFLRRLQRTKVFSQNDSALPTGQQFCFEAMVDKRYNRWKRRRKKKQAEARRTSLVQGSDSSDDERNNAMEEIIDKMYEQIHGPVPQTPNGSYDTPRARNRRRRKVVKDQQNVPVDSDDESNTELILSESRVLLSPTLEQTDNAPETRVKFQLGPDPPDGDATGETSWELSSWPYLEQYKQEILKRLKETSPDQLKDRLQSDDDDDVNQNDEQDFDDDEEYRKLDAEECGCQDDEQYDNEGEEQHGVRRNEKRDYDVTGEWDNRTVTATPDDFEPYNRVDAQREASRDRHSVNAAKPPQNDPLSVTAKPPQNDPLFNTAKPPQNDPLFITAKPPQNDPLFNTAKPPQNDPLINTSLKPPQTDPLINTSLQPPQNDPLSNTSLQPPQNDPLINTSLRSFSYNKLSKPATIKKPARRLSRESISNSSEKSFEPTPIESVDIVAVRQSSEEPLINPIESIPRKGSKVALRINKQNVNLPSLTKNSKGQTLPYSIRKNGNERIKIIEKEKTRQRSKSERLGVEAPSSDYQRRSSIREPHTVPDFLVPRNPYMDYARKSRINSHIRSKKELRKTSTVGSLKELKKVTPLKKPEDSRPYDLAFTRSFTFSMFDLPDMHKLYNTNLERRAKEQMDGHL